MDNQLSGFAELRTLAKNPPPRYLQLDKKYKIGQTFIEYF